MYSFLKSRLPPKKNKTAEQQIFPLLRWIPYFISAKKTFIKNRLGKILDNLLRINMMSVASSNSKNSPRKGRELFLPHYQGTAWSSSILVQFMLKVGKLR